MDRNNDRCKVAYSWTSPDPAKAGPTLGGGGVIVLLKADFNKITLNE